MDPNPGIDGDIDSLCYAPPIDADGPVDDTCGKTATTYVFLHNGVRRYVCPEHVEEVNRFDDGSVDENHPTVTECDRCLKLTPINHVDRDMICDACRR